MSQEDQLFLLIKAVNQMNDVIQQLTEVHGELLKEAYISLTTLENQVEYLTKEVSELKKPKHNGVYGPGSN